MNPPPPPKKKTKKQKKKKKKLPLFLSAFAVLLKKTKKNSKCQMTYIYIPLCVR